MPKVLLQVVQDHSSSLTSRIKCAVFKLRKAPPSLVDFCLGILSLMLLLVFLQNHPQAKNQPTHKRHVCDFLHTHKWPAAFCLTSTADLTLLQPVIECYEFIGVSYKTLIY